MGQYGPSCTDMPHPKQACGEVRATQTGLPVPCAPNRSTVLDQAHSLVGILQEIETVADRIQNIVRACPKDNTKAAECVPPKNCDITEVLDGAFLIAQSALYILKDVQVSLGCP